MVGEDGREQALKPALKVQMLGNSVTSPGVSAHSPDMSTQQVGQHAMTSASALQPPAPHLVTSFAWLLALAPSRHSHSISRNSSEAKPQFWTRFKPAIGSSCCNG